MNIKFQAWWLKYGHRVVTGSGVVGFVGSAYLTGWGTKKSIEKIQKLQQAEILIFLLFPVKIIREGEKSGGKCHEVVIFYRFSPLTRKRKEKRHEHADGDV